MKKYDSIVYQVRKEEARRTAQEWQHNASEKNYSYSELQWYQSYFEKLGKRYGLLKEFRENGII